MTMNEFTGSYLKTTSIMVNQSKKNKTNLQIKNYQNVIAVFTTAELEKMPNLRIDPPGPDIINLPEKGQRKWTDVSNNTRELCEQIVMKIRHRIEERKMMIKPLFKDYDKLIYNYYY